MSVVLSNPELTAFLKDQVERGYYESLEAALEASVARMMLDRDDEPLDAATLEAIERAEQNVADGKFMEWTQAKADIKRSLGL